MTMIDLPPDLREYVGAFSARRRRLALVRAVALATTVAIVIVLASCLVDRLAALSAPVRLALLVLNGVVVALVLWRPIRQCMRRDVDFLYESRAIERRDARFGERLQTVTSQLLDRQAVRGSDAFLSELTREVSAQTKPGDSTRLVPTKLVARSWFVVLGCVLLALALTTFSWLDLPRLLARYTAPLADIAPVTTTRLTLLGASSADRSVVQGSAFTVGVTARALPERSTPVLEITSDGGDTFSRVAMSPGKTPEQFEFLLPSVDRSFAFRVTGGDASTRLIRVAVLPRPVVTEFRVRYTYPPYMNRAPLNVTNTDGLVEAPVGTDAQLAVVSSQPLKSAALVIEKVTTPLAATIEPTVFQARLKLQKASSYTVKLASVDGVDGAGPAGSVIRVLPDRAPLVQVVRPESDLRLGPRDLLAAQYRALDDFGVASLSLRVQVNGSEPRVSPMKLSRDPRLNEGSQVIDLAAFGLKVGDVVTYAFVGEDALKQQGTSDVRRVLISPRSIEMNTYQRLVELRGTEELAKQLVIELSQANDAMTEARKRRRELAIREQGLISKAYQHLAGAGESADGLRQALLRTMTVTPTPAVSTAVASWLDDTQLIADLVERVDDQDFDSREDLPKRGLSAPLERAKSVLADVTMLTRSQSAMTLLAERDNVRRTPGEAANELAKVQLERAKQDLNDGIRQLGLDPNAGDVDAKLAEVVRAGDEMTKARKGVSWAAASKKWGEELGDVKLPAPLRLDARLNVAAQAEAIRPDGDLVWARDQQLASRAAARAQGIREQTVAADEASTTLISEVSAQFSDALQIIRRGHRLREKGGPGDDASLQGGPAKVLAEAEAARVLLRRWAGQDDTVTGVDSAKLSAEQLAMEASAATAQKQYDKADALDKARDEAASATKAEPGKLQEKADNAQSKADAGKAVDAPKSTDVVKSADAPKSADAAKGVDAAKSAGEKAPVDDAPSKATDLARRLDDLKRKQDALAEQTAGAKKDQSTSLAEQQKQLSQAISQAQDTKRQDEPVASDTPADDSRRAASEAIVAVQEKLAAMPEQLDKAQRASDEAAEARSKADAAAQAAAEADKQAGAAEQRAVAKANDAEAARRAVDDAAKAAQNADEKASSAQSEARAEQAKADAAQADAATAQGLADEAKKKAEATTPAGADEAALADAKRQAEEGARQQTEAQQAKAQADSAAKASAEAAAKAASAKEQAGQAKEQTGQATKDATAAKDAATNATAGAKAAREQAGAASTASARAKAQADEASTRATPSLDPVHPDVAEDLSRKLGEFAPETTAATDAIDQTLTPALRELRRAAASNDKAATAKATQSARKAIESAQAALRDAQNQLIDQDPLAAAEWFADQAAEALKGNPPDMQKAAANQQGASAALQRAWSNSVQQAARDRLAGTASMSSVFQPGAIRAGQMMPVDSMPAGAQARREWGQLRQRTPEELSAGSRQNDPPGYEESLKAYFEALGKGATEGTK